MRVKAAIEGNLNAIMKQEVVDATAGVVAGIQQATDLLQSGQRSQITRAGLGRGLSKGWRKKFYRNEGLDAAGLVYHKSRKIITAFDQGTVVRVKKRKYLAIPTEHARKMAKRSVGRFGSVTPGSWPKNLPPLRYVPRRGAPDLLVVDEVRITKTGRISKAKRTKTGKMGRGASTVVAFVLIRQIRIDKRIDVDKVSERAHRLMPELINRNIRTSPVKEG